MRRFFDTSKRGSVEVQFSWIFVIIVGALILLFFLSVVKTTQTQSDEKLYSELLVYLDNIISGAEVDVGTTRTIGMPRLTLTLDCNRLGMEQSSYEGEEIYYKTVFSPNKISGREMLAYSLYFEMPYSVDYFLYLTSREVRYNFVNNTGCTPCQALLAMIIKYLPMNTTINVVNDVVDVFDNNYYKERFIFFGQNPSDLTVSESIKSMKNKDVTAINIETNTLSYGEVVYYTKDGGEFTETLNTSYLGLPMLLGAVISEDELYECNVNKTLLKFGIMSEIYSKRIDYLIEVFSIYTVSSPLSICKQIYERMDFNETLDSLARGIDSGAFREISGNAGNIGDLNERLIIESCPLIY